MIVEVSIYFEAPQMLITYDQNVHINIIAEDIFQWKYP